MATTDFDWEGFRALVGRVDSLLTDEPKDPETYADDCRRALAFLYTAGVSMPQAGDIFEDAGGDAFWERTLSATTVSIDPAAAEERVEALAERIGASVDALQPDEIDEETDEEFLLIAAALWEVDAALAAGVNHYDAKRLHEAAWEWSFGFDEWGGQVLVALTGLHDVLWGAR